MKIEIKVSIDTNENEREAQELLEILTAIKHKLLERDEDYYDDDED